MKGLILSAGMGTRLDPLTRTRPKCMVEVAGRPMMEHQLDSLQKAGVRDCIIVVGYMADSIREYFGARHQSVKLSYVENAAFAETNNLYSLWLAREEFDDDLLLLEGDLVFDDRLVSQLIQMDEQNVAMVDRYRPFMDGTVILADGGVAESMVLKADQGPEFDFGPALKTVNIYRLCNETLTQEVVPEMELFLARGRADQYYEAVFSSLIRAGRMDMAVMKTGDRRWAEVDTLGDLHEAEKMFDATSAAAS